jgi:type IX secretion system PorP/SprF family membrane protein
MPNDSINNLIMNKPSYLVKLLLCFICLYSLSATAQQDQLYLTYPFLPMTINPAYAGAKEVVSMAGIYRKRPLFSANGVASTTQQYFNFDMPIAQDRMGIGFQAYNADQAVGIGGNLAGNLGLYGDFAYRFDMPSDGKLAIGLQAGITQVPAIFVGTNNGGTRFRSSLGLGVYYKNDDWYAGLSMPNINASDNYASPMFLTLGYLFDIGDDLKLKAGTLVRRISNDLVSSTEVDFNGVLWVKERVGIGVWYQNTGSEFVNKAVLGSLEIQLSKMRIGYSYDFNGANSNAATGSPANQGFHQIMLRFDFDAGNGKSASFKYF